MQECEPHRIRALAKSPSLRLGGRLLASQRAIICQKHPPSVSLSSLCPLSPFWSPNVNCSRAFHSSCLRQQQQVSSRSVAFLAKGRWPRPSRLSTYNSRTIYHIILSGVQLTYRLPAIHAAYCLKKIRSCYFNGSVCVGCRHSMKGTDKGATVIGSTFS